MFGENRKKVDKGIRKVDALITGLILGGIVASVYGIKKYEESKKIPENIEKNEGKMSGKKLLSGLIFGFKKEEKEVVEKIKKPGIIRIVLTGIFRLIRGLGKKQ